MKRQLAGNIIYIYIYLVIICGSLRGVVLLFTQAGKWVNYEGMFDKITL